MLVYMTIVCVLIWCGTIVHEEYDKSYDEYEQCLDDNNCIKECSVSGSGYSFKFF